LLDFLFRIADDVFLSQSFEETLTRRHVSLHAKRPDSQHVHSLGVIVPHKSRLELIAFALGGHLAELFGNLATGGVSELAFSNWYRRITQFTYQQEYPSAAAAREEVPGFEVPVAGSKGIKAVSFENFQRLRYGSAALVMGDTAVSAASAIGHYASSQPGAASARNSSEYDLRQPRACRSG